MGKTVEQRRRHLWIAEHGGPFAKAEVGRDDDAGSLVQFAQKVEEQRSVGAAERQIAKLIEDDEVGVSKARRDLPRLSLNFLLFEGVDEFDRGEEPDSFAMMFDRLDADRSREVRLACAGTADEHGVVRVLQELAAVKLADERLVDFAAGKVEAGEVAVVRKAGRFELVGG